VAALTAAELKDKKHINLGSYTLARVETEGVRGLDTIQKNINFK